MRRAGLLALVMLIPLFGVSPDAQGVELPSAGSWQAYLDPLAFTPIEWDIAEGDDELAILGEFGGKARFARSTEGAESWTATIIIDNAITGANHPQLMYGGGTTWFAAFEDDTGSWYVYSSTDNGDTWAQKQSRAQAVDDIAIAKIGSRYGVAIAETGATVKWFRTSNAFTSWDKTNVAISTDTTHTKVGIIPWNANQVDVWFIKSAGNQIQRVHSNDGGSFFTSPTSFTGSGQDVQPAQALSIGWDGIRAVVLVADHTTLVSTWVVTSPNSQGTFKQISFASGGTICSNAGHAGPGSVTVKDGHAYAYICVGGTNTGQGTWELWELPEGGSAWAHVSSGPNLPNDVHGDLVAGYAGRHTYYAFRNADFSNRFEIHVLGGAAGGTFSPAATYTATGGDVILGFDVDEAGQTAIIRDRDSGNTLNRVRTMSGTGLDSPSTSGDTNCDRPHGVASIGTHVSYLHCSSSDSNDVTQLRIRSASLGTPAFGPSCIDDIFTSGNSCDENIDDDKLDSNEDNSIHLDDVKSFPFDYNRASSKAITATVFMAWAFSTIDGDMGVVTKTFRNNAVDKSNFATVSVDPSGGPLANICATRGTDGKDYLYGASPSSTVIGSRVDFTEQTGANADIEVKLQPLFQGHAITANAQGVGCGADRFFVANLNTMSMWERSGTNYALLWSAPVPEVPLGQTVGMSNHNIEGQCAFFFSATRGYLYNATSGALLATLAFDLGSENPIAAQADSSCQNVWIATDSKVRRYEVFTATTGVPVVPGVDFTPPSVDGGTGSGLFGGGGGTIGAALGIGSTAGGLLLALLATVALGAAGAAGLRENRVLGAIGGVVGGIMFSWAFEFLSDGFVFVIVLLGAGFLAMRFFTGSRAEA